MFEAGALSKNLGKSKVCPLLFDLAPTDLKGPLVQFQAAPFREDEMRRVVSMINDELGPQALAQSVVDSVFNMWWPRLDQQVRSILAKPLPDHGDVRSDRDILEEVLELSRIAVTEGISGPVRSIAVRAVNELAHRYCQTLRVAHGMRDNQALLEELRALFGPVRHIVTTRGGPKVHDNTEMLRVAAESFRTNGAREGHVAEDA
jgi:hypothetical protein